MKTRILGVSLGCILVVVAIVIVVRMWGNEIPLLNNIPAG